MTINVCICDDNPELMKGWGGSLSDLGLDIEILPLDKEDLANAVRELEDRRAYAADESRPVPKEIGEAVLDKVDVLIVDYDLLELDARSYLTGENVAYLARAYSSCGFILAMNQFGRCSFDLTMKGHVESFADLNIGSEQLSNPNLWGEIEAGFNPWHWPVVQNWLAAQEDRVKQIEAELDALVFGFFGFDEEIVETMPLSILEWVTPRGEEKRSTEITFRDVVTRSPLGVREKDAMYIKGTGYLDDAQLKKIVAARLSKWLERMVLPCLEYLIDAPHLALRFPSLCGGIEKIAERSGTNLKAHPIEIDGVISRFAFKRPNWLSKPVWWMHHLRECEDLLEVSNPWDVEFPTQVFCEDISTFCERGEARSFIAEMPTAAPQRWIKGIKGVDYNPSVRFAL